MLEAYLVDGGIKRLTGRAVRGHGDDSGPRRVFLHFIVYVFKPRDPVTRDS